MDLIGKEFKVGHAGFIRVVDVMGNDAAIVQAARTSYGKGTKTINKDRGLIRYLMRNWHTSPFEMCEIKLHIKCPIHVWRQWIRHRTASVNEYSTRYSEAPTEAEIIGPEDWRYQSKGNKQGSDGNLPRYEGLGLFNKFLNMVVDAQEFYRELLSKGVAREQARNILPLAQYTEAYWKIDLHNLLHFLRLRMDDHAQKEIREFATIIGEEIVANWCPHTWEAYKDYRMNSISFSGLEQGILKYICTNDLNAACMEAESVGFLGPLKDDFTFKRSRECKEFENKIISIGLSVPWKT